MTTTVTTPSKLLADPAQVAVVRDLIRYARKAGAEHATYAFGDGKGGSIRPFEHVWKLGAARVSYLNDALTYERHNTHILSGAGFDAVDVAQLLAAIGVLPMRFAEVTR